MRRRTFLSYSSSALLSPAFLLGQQSQLAVTPLSADLFELTGSGGNIALLKGADGLLMVDSGLAPDAANIAAKARTVLANIPVLINTHWHYDHVGGNVTLGKAGTKIIAHENTKKRLSTPQHLAAMNQDVPALEAPGRPVETIATTKLKHGKETIAVHAMPPAHTDGDIILHFENANVLHTGDLLFNGFFPFIDYSSNGSIEGMVAAADRMLKLVDAKTRIIPGHGPIANAADLRAFRDMLDTANAGITKLVKEGKTLSEIQTANPLSTLDPKWSTGFFKPNQFVELIVRGKRGA